MKIRVCVNRFAGRARREDLGQLIPSAFIQRWFWNSTSVTPINVFMVADIVRNEFYTTASGLLFFDRCRLMDYLPEKIDENLISKIKS